MKDNQVVMYGIKFCAVYAPKGRSDCSSKQLFIPSENKHSGKQDH